MEASGSQAAQGCAGCAALQEQVRQLQALLAQQQQEIRELKARLDQNSSNSHKPPSSDPPWTGKRPAPKKPSGRKPGGQIGHEGHWRHRLPPQRVDEVVHHVPKLCRRCHAALAQNPSVNDPPPSWHQVADLPAMAAIITEHQGHARRCSRCGTVTRQPIPASVRRQVIGPRLAAVMSYLAGRCHDGRRCVQEILQDLFDVPIALGTVSRYEQQTRQALNQPYEQVLKHVRAAGVKYVDETGWKQAGQRCWLWTAACGDAAAYAIQSGRNFKGLCHLLGSDEGGKGMVCSDRLHAYSLLGLSRRQLCWAHLKRDFQKWLDQAGPTRLLGRDGAKLCESVFGLWRDFRLGKFKRKQLIRRIAPLRRRMRQVLDWGLRCGVSKAVQFCRHLRRDEQALWSFARVKGLEPTNNHAERMLRCAVLWRKNSFGAHSDQGCRFVERMLTVVQTLRLRGTSVANWLHEAVCAHRAGLPAPLLA